LDPSLGFAGERVHIMTMKIPVEDGMIIMVKVDPKAIRECYAQSLKVAL